MSKLRKLFGNIPDEPVRSKDLEPKRIIGKIIHIQEEEGWGFITSHEDGYKFTRIFFHWTGLDKDTFHFLDLKKKMKVEFEPKNMEQGLRAIKIRVLDDGQIETSEDSSEFEVE